MKYFHLRSIVSILTACLFCYSKEFFVTAKVPNRGNTSESRVNVEISFTAVMEMLLPDNRMYAVSWPRLITQPAFLSYQQLQASMSGSWDLPLGFAVLRGTIGCQFQGSFCATGKMHWISDWRGPCFLSLPILLTFCFIQTIT